MHRKDNEIYLEIELRMSSQRMITKGKCIFKYSMPIGASDLPNLKLCVKRPVEFMIVTSKYFNPFVKYILQR